jgi:hypothetical protein
MKTEIRITHIGGPTALIEVEGWRLLTDPTFDPGPPLQLRLGNNARGLQPCRVASTDRPQATAERTGWLRT